MQEYSNTSGPPKNCKIVVVEARGARVREAMRARVKGGSFILRHWQCFRKEGKKDK